MCGVGQNEGFGVPFHRFGISQQTPTESHSRYSAVTAYVRDRLGLCLLKTQILQKVTTDMPACCTQTYKHSIQQLGE